MILGMLEHIEVLLPLGVMGLAAEFTPKVNQPRPECTCVTGQARCLCPWLLLVLVKPSGVGTGIMSGSLVIL